MTDSPTTPERDTTLEMDSTPPTTPREANAEDMMEGTPQKPPVKCTTTWWSMAGTQESPPSKKKEKRSDGKDGGHQ